MANLANITEGILSNIRRWHGSIDDQFGNINNLIDLLNEHSTEWEVSSVIFGDLSNRRDELRSLISHCRSNECSVKDRALRNALLKSTVGFCLLQVKQWAYGAYAAGTVTAEDVHGMGFLLPCETGEHHDHTDTNDVRAEVKVQLINDDFIQVVINQSAGENAALTAHGWPQGFKSALILITSPDGKSETYRQMTSRLHNNIRMPDSTRGKQLIVKAAFLKHPDDDPQFGNEPSFSMPLSFQDLADTLDRQHHEEFEAHVREIERQRQEIERLQAELATQKK
jgi:hypothetical protein